MKLWKKIVILVLAVQVLSFIGFSQVLLNYMEKRQLSAILETRTEHADNVAMLLEKVTDATDYSDMTDITRRSMAGFFLKKYAPKDYAIADLEETLASTCEYEVTPYPQWYREEPGAAFHTVQSLDHKKILIVSENITLWQEKYALYGIKDITYIYEELQEISYRLFAAGAGILFVTCMILILSIKRMLHPLKKLAFTAQSIQNGDYGARNGSLSGKTDEIGTLALAFDQMACEVEYKIEELEEAAKRQQQLLGALSHEIKTPVTSLIGYSDTLLHVKLSEEQKEKALNRLYEESRRLERLSAKLMSLIGLYENDSIQKEILPIQKVMEDVRQITRRSLEEKEITALFSWEDFDMEMDCDLMESLLINLMDNSRKASSPGGLIEVRAVKGRLSVKDYGCGIQKEELEKVKEPFYMVDKARKKREGSIGLGLALCTQIARLHGGKIEILSALGEGTCVSFVWTAKL